MKVRIKKKANFGATMNPITDLQVEGNQISPLSDSFSVLGGNTHKNGGTDIAYNGQVVEAQKGEPVSKNLDGDVVAWGKMKNPLTGRMFESDAKLLAKEENKNSKIRDKATELSMKDPSNERESFSFMTAAVLQDAFNQRNNSLIDKKESYANMQQDILDFSDALGIKPKKLAEKMAKNGATIKKAAEGDVIKKQPYPFGSVVDYVQSLNSPQVVSLPEVTVAAPITTSTPTPTVVPVNTRQREVINPLPINEVTPLEVNMTTPSSNPLPNDWYDRAAREQSTINSVEKEKKPSLADQNKLNLAGILPEIAAALDRPGYVEGQYYNPTLYSPYRISFQDQVNENNAAFNQIARSLRNNPEALSTLAADLYQRNNAVQAQEFRTNQEIANQVNNQNISLLNQAQLQNNQYSDQQYVRQEMARANTQANRQAALQSISNKVLQNKAENNYIRQMESMSGFRGDTQGNITNMNDAAVFYFGTNFNNLTTEQQDALKNVQLKQLKDKTSTQQKAKFGRLIK